MWKGLSEFLAEPGGQILLRFICVSMIGAGVLGMNFFINEGKSKKRGSKVSDPVSGWSHFFAANAVIFMSIIVSYRFDRHELGREDYVIDGILYGLGFIGFYFMITSERFLKMFLIWRKK